MDLRSLVFSSFIFFLACSPNNHEETFYFQGTFDEAIKEAKQEDKYILLDFYTVWCGGCKSYDRFVFSDSIVREYLESNFIFKSVDAEKDEGIELKNHFEVVGFPTLIIADANGDEVGRKVGFENRFIDSFINLLDMFISNNNIYRIVLYGLDISLVEFSTGCYS